MRGIWLIDSLGPGGAEALMLPLIQNLKVEIMDPRICVLTVRQGNPIASQLIETGIPVDLIEVRNLRHFSGIWKLYQHIRGCQPDIIHTQLETSDILGALISRLLGIPSVSTQHTLDNKLGTGKKFIRNQLRWFFLKHFSKRVIVVSEITRQHYLGLGFQSSSLEMIHNGIDVQAYQHNESVFASKRELFGIPDNALVITTVAVLREPKGIQYMLNALPSLLAAMPDVYYVIVGDGPYRFELEKLANTLGITDHVVFMKHQKDIPKILSASNVFAFPTLQDALPTAILEAMAAGVPVVASCTGGVPEIIMHEVTGLLVPSGDQQSLSKACLRLLKDPEFAAQLATAASNNVRSCFDINMQAEKILKLYHQTVHGSQA